MKPADYILEVMAKRSFERGNKGVLLNTLCQCCLEKRPLPEWVREAFIDVHNSVMEYKIESWDDVFGPMHPKGTHVGKERRELEIGYRVVGRVVELRRKRRVDKDLYKEIGMELKIGSGTKVHKIYSKYRDRLEALGISENEILGISKKK
jgi:hypothetical protein